MLVVTSAQSGTKAQTQRRKPAPARARGFATNACEQRGIAPAGLSQRPGYVCERRGAPEPRSGRFDDVFLLDRSVAMAHNALC